MQQLRQEVEGAMRAALQALPPPPDIDAGDAAAAVPAPRPAFSLASFQPSDSLKQQIDGLYDLPPSVIVAALVAIAQVGSTTIQAVRCIASNQPCFVLLETHSALPRFVCCPVSF